MEYYIFSNDTSGKKIKKALMQKAREGVEVRFLYDNVGTWFVPSHFYNEMKADGVKVSPFMKVKFPYFKNKINYRNHRKIVVIDGRI
jgi:cardiolipin synthase